MFNREVFRDQKQFDDEKVFILGLLKLIPVTLIESRPVRRSTFIGGWRYENMNEYEEISKLLIL